MSDHEQQQFFLLSDLARGLANLQSSLLVPDASDIERHSSEQMEICKAFTLLSSTPISTGNQLKIPLTLRAIRERVLHLNRVNQGIIWRSRRSLEIFSCLLTSLAATYEAPLSGSATKAIPEGR